MSDRRERLLEAMVYVVSRHGYAGASVARVVERAGVSRATFYVHFGDREECFLLAYRAIVERARERIRVVARNASPRQRPQVVLATLLELVAADPAAARLILVEALAAGPSIRAEHERQIATLEHSIEGFLERDQQLQVPAPALLGGVAGTISMHVFAGEGKSLGGLGDDLLAWLDSYALSGSGLRWGAERWRALGEGLPPRPIGRDEGPPGLLPRGRGVLPQADAAKARHGRIVAATAAMTAEKGYARLTVADIVTAARVTRAAFYSHFRGKEEAFLAAQAVALQESIGAAASEFFGGEGWPERVWGASGALLSYIATHPDLAMLGVVEAHAVGPAAINRQHDARSAYGVFLEEGYREAERTGRRLPRAASDAIAWAVFALIRRQVARGRVTQVLELAPQIAYTILAPFIGSSAALEFVEGRTQAAARAP